MSKSYWEELRQGVGEECHSGDPKQAPSEKQPMSYSAGTIMTTEQVADWLQVSTRQVIALKLPRLVGLGRVARYDAGAVLQALSAQSPEASPAREQKPRR